MKRLIAPLALAAIAVTATSVQAEKWNFAAAYSAGLFHTKNIQQFAADVKTMTSGGLDITVHPGGALIKKNKDNRNAVRSGQIQAGEFLGAWFSNEDPVWAIDTLPFTATSYGAAGKLWKASKPAIEKILDKNKLKLLFAVPWPPQALYSVKALDTMADLKGIKFRTYSPFTSRIAQLAGAAGTEIQPPLATAFQTGRVQAMIGATAEARGAQGFGCGERPGRVARGERPVSAQEAVADEPAVTPEGVDLGVGERGRQLEVVDRRSVDRRSVDGRSVDCRSVDRRVAQGLSRSCVARAWRMGRGGQAESRRHYRNSASRTG